MIRKVVLILVVLMFCASLAFADILGTEVDCTFQEQEVSEIVKGLSQQTGIEILLDPAIKGKISLELGRVPLNKAVEQIAVLVGGFPGFVGGRIYLASSDPKGPYYLAILETKIIPIGHLGVKQIIGLTPDGKQLIGYLSKHPIAQYLTADEETNTISVTAPGPIAEYAEAVIKGLDVPQNQLRIEATVIDDSSINTKDKGVQFEWPLGPPDPNGVRTISFAGTIFGYTNQGDGQTLFNLYNYDSRDQLKILAQPSVVVQDGKTANISFGKTFYATIGSVLGGTAKIEAIKAGVSLKVIPRVIKNSEGQVTDILTDIEAIVDDVVSTGSGTISLVTNSRMAKMTLCIKNGETVIIGGLVSSQDYWIRGKTPVLGDIPLLGNLFRTSRKDIRQQKVTVLVTARVIEPEKAAVEAQPAEKEIRERAPAIGVPTPSLPTVP